MKFTLFIGSACVLAFGLFTAVDLGAQIGTFQEKLKATSEISDRGISGAIVKPHNNPRVTFYDSIPSIFPPWAEDKTDTLQGYTIYVIIESQQVPSVFTSDRWIKVAPITTSGIELDRAAWAYWGSVKGDSPNFDYLTTIDQKYISSINEFIEDSVED